MLPVLICRLAVVQGVIEVGSHLVGLCQCGGTQAGERQLLASASQGQGVGGEATDVGVAPVTRVTLAWI